MDRLRVRFTGIVIFPVAYDRIDEVLLSLTVIPVFKSRVYKECIFFRRFVMHLGKDFWIVARIIMAIIDALRKMFEKENEDDPDHNGEK